MRPTPEKTVSACVFELETVHPCVFESETVHPCVFESETNGSHERLKYDTVSKGMKCQSA